ncbi:hypothetical protein KA005_68890, partial [bacterium]|nr:hypothetical protein [bacterium]
VKKSKALLGAGIGVLIGGGGGALLGSKVEEGGRLVLYLGGIGALGGALIGGIIIDLFRTDKTIHFEGMTDSEIQETLDKLRKKARIRDYK